MTKQRTPDFFYGKAKKDGFAARSVFKLEEIDGKYRLFRPGMKVLDLGAAPGSWLCYLAERVGAAGRVVGVDRNDLRTVLPGNAEILKADIFAVTAADLGGAAEKFDAVVSDLAPKTTGDRDGDHVRSVELCERAFDLASQMLKRGGHFICKIFQGKDSPAFLRKIHGVFEMVKTQKPMASRGESREVFVVALRFRG